MITIDKLYTQWWTAVGPADATEIQTTEIRRAFYSGCAGMLHTMMAVEEAAGEDLDAAADHLQELNEEIQKYFEDQVIQG